MSEHDLENSPLPPAKQLANLYDSLADDVFDVPFDTDYETERRASRIVRATLKKAPGFAEPSQPRPKLAFRVRFIGSPHYDAQWFAHTFGLHPVLAVLLAIAAVVLWGYFDGWIRLVCTIPLGILTWMMQKDFYEEDSRTASCKAIVVSALLAIDIAVALLVFLTAGILGKVWNNLRRKARKRTPETQSK